MELVAERFRALGDANRLRILCLLSAEEMRVKDLVERLATTQANVSKHLGVLKAVGLVTSRKVGSSTYYGIADPSLEGLCDQVCRGVAAQAESYTRAAEVLRSQESRETL